MIQKIKSYLLPLAAVLMLAAPALATTGMASADAITGCGSVIANGVATGANDAASGGSSTDGAINCSGTGTNGETTIEKLSSNIVDIFSIVVGAVAVIMIIVSGFRYITSGGDSGRVGGAKNSLIYAIIGLVIVAVAQLIVHFVISQSNGLGT